MGYYIRVLGRNTTGIPLQKLQEVADPAVIEVQKSEGDEWRELSLRHKSGQEIAVIEKNRVIEGELGAEELEEFKNEVVDYQPQSAAVWLQKYLPTINVIYAFQLLSGTDVDDGWNVLHKIHSAVWNFAGGILQSDGEGFTNEKGYTILWQFSDTVTGSWNVAVLTDEMLWSHFEIDLENESHREAFKLGKVPPGVTILLSPVTHRDVL